MDHSLFTVFYEAPYWVGVIELTVDGQYSVARIVFGAEPTEAEVLDFLAKNHPRRLIFTAASAENGEAPGKARPVSPKRRQRQASQLLEGRGISTKAQESLQKAYEQGKNEKRQIRRQDREERERQKYLQKLEKKKLKKRGK